MNLAVALASGDVPAAAAQTMRGGVVAVDIETSGLDWRTDAIGTVQLYAPSLGAIIVVPDGSRPDVLVGLLQDRRTRKVFHHASFDLAFLVSEWSVRVSSVSCTKIASKILRPQADRGTHSLAPLLRRTLDVALDKGPVRVSDWTAVELTAEQVEYAASDVRHLLDLEQALRPGLRAAGRLGLYEDCCAFLPTQATLTVGGFPAVFDY